MKSNVACLFAGLALAVSLDLHDAAAGPAEDLPEYTRSALRCRAGYKGEIRPVGGGPELEVGCRSTDRWDGAVKMFRYADLARVTYYDAGALKSTVKLHANGIPKGIRNFDARGAVTQTLVFKEDGVIDPSGVWGP